MSKAPSPYQTYCITNSFDVILSVSGLGYGQPTLVNGAMVGNHRTIAQTGTDGK